MGRSRSSIDDVDDIEMAEPTLTSPLRYGYSHGSIGRFSEHSLHSAYRLGGYKTCDDKCNDCLLRIPYATLIATIMCLVGVGTFIGTINRGATLTSLLMNEVFHFRTDWLEAMKILFLIMGVCTAALGLMILFVGCLATGATRHRVYRAWRARVSGRISCAVFLCIAYVFLFIWLLLFSFLIIVTLHYTVFWGLCSSHRVQEELQCIDLTQFVFMFPNNSRIDDMQVCDAFEIKLFCKDYVEKAENMFILATTANLLVILSLVHYLMCLSANYAHIRDHEKFQELQELQYLTSPDGLAASRSRF